MVLKKLRNVAIGIAVIIMCFQIGGAFLMFMFCISLGLTISRLIDWFLPIIKEEKKKGNDE